GEYLREMLVGQILWVNLGDLLPLLLLTGLFLGLWRTGRIQRRPAVFYAAFAVLITLSVQLVGVYLVFASLILPALAAPQRVVPAWLIGACGYALGLLASALWDLPSGAAIVCAIAVCAAVGGTWLRRPQ
ncbi:MAG: metal ABC transporter permease, partial [Gammaproteobacteria bacterium]